MIVVLEAPATPDQLSAMLEALHTYVKVAVDVREGILAGGGHLHADCEAALLERGSRQEDVWGADWMPATAEVRYESFINIRPSRGNPSMGVLDPEIRDEMSAIIRRLLER